MDKVRIGIIGYGKMGSQHVKSFVDGKIPNAVLTCVADIDEKRIEAAKALLGDSVSYFSTAEDLIHSGACDAVIPTVPHYFHPVYAIESFKAGLHYLCEKPAGVYTKQVEEMNRVAAESGKIEMILFSVNPAFDMLPASEDLNDYFKDEYYANAGGITPERAELYRICEQNGVGITVMKGYAGGRLLDAKTSPFGVALTPVQCIHYALTRPAVASVLTGFDSIGHVDAAVAYETASEEEKDYATVLAGAPAHAYSGQCTYCGHCAPCPAGIDIAMVNKLLDLALMHDEVPATVRAHYKSLSANGADCTSCRGCERRCPFGVHVSERMKQAESVFA